MLLKFAFPVVLSEAFFGLPIGGLQITELQALNRVLEKLCSHPPR